MSELKKQMGATRRDFLKTAGMASAGMAAATVFPVRRMAHAAGSDVIQVGLVGCGGRGFGSLMDRFAVGDAMKVVAIGDVHKGVADMKAEQLAQMDDKKSMIDLPPDHVFGGFDNYKKVTDLADLVLIASPPSFHPDHYSYAVESGKHVFVEKPFCVDAEGYRRCMKANRMAEEKGLTVCAGFQRRHEKKYHEWISRIHDGAVGDIVASRVYWNGGGAKDRGKWTTDETEMSFQTHCWYVFNWLSGDHIVEQHCHNIDTGNWIHGKGDPLAHPVSCVGHGGRQMRKTPELPYHMCGNIFDHHYVEYRYADGHVMHSMCRQTPNCWNLVEEQIVGTKGRGETGRLHPTGGEEWEYPRRNQDKSPYIQEHINQSEAMRGGKKLHDGWSAATSSMTAVMGWMATYSGQEIQWDDAVSKGRTIFPYNQELTFDTKPPVTMGSDGTYEHAVAVPGKYDPFE